MKRIFIDMEEIKKIVENHVWCMDNRLRPEFTLDHKEADIRVYIDEEGANVMIPNGKGPED